MYDHNETSNIFDDSNRIYFDLKKYLTTNPHETRFHACDYCSKCRGEYQLGKLHTFKASTLWWASASQSKPTGTTPCEVRRFDSFTVRFFLFVFTLFLTSI